MEKYFIPLVAAGIAVRLLISYTNLRYPYPDAIFQTIEFGHFLQAGIITPVYEFLAHMRNLTFPVMLTLPMGLSDFFFPGSPFAKTVLVNLFIALLDLVGVWGAWTYGKAQLTNKMTKALWFFFILFFWLNVKRSMAGNWEHLSIVAFWLGLGIWQKTSSHFLGCFLAGIALMLSTVFRYPSGFFLIGIAAAIIGAGLAHKPLSLRRLIPLAVGAIFALVIGGVSDWAFYGRPYESLWMYMQYNLFTGIAAEHFGATNAFAYFEFFREYFLEPTAPVGIFVILFFPLGLWRGLRQWKWWAWGLLLFFLGHLIPSHKDPRFMEPLFTLVIFGSLYGWERARFRWLRKARIRKMAKALFVLFLVSHSIKLIQTLSAETFSSRANYFTALEKYDPNRDCALITNVEPPSLWMPLDENAKLRHPIALFRQQHKQSIKQQVSAKPLHWFEEKPTCNTEDTLIVEWKKADPEFVENHGCTKFYSAYGSFVATLQKVSPHIWTGAIYRCPSTLLEIFPTQKITYHFSRHLRTFTHLPPYGASAEEFRHLVQ